jgi:hypothetical protein
MTPRKLRSVTGISLNEISASSRAQKGEAGVL